MDDRGASHSPDDLAGDVRRDQSFKKAAFSGVLARLAGAALSLATLGLAARGLSPTQFGAMSTFLAIFQIGSTIDLGLGNGLISALSRAAGRDDVDAQRAAIGAATRLMVLCGAAVAGVGILLILETSVLQAAFGANSPEIMVASMVVAVLSGLGIPAMLGYQVQVGLQDGARAVQWATASSIMSALATGIVYASSGGLLYYVFALIGVPVVTQCLQTVLELTIRRPALRPWRGDNWSLQARQLGRTSGLYMAISLSSSVLNQSGVLVVTYTLGAASAGTFYVASRMASLVATTIFLATRQFWPAAAEALGHGRYLWVRRRFRTTLAWAAGISSLASACIVVFGGPVARLWVGPDLVPDQTLLWASAIWCVYSVVMTQYSLLLNAAHLIAVQAVIVVLAGVSALVLSIIITPKVGDSGPMWAALCAHLIFAGPASVWMGARLLHTYRREAERESK